MIGHNILYYNFLLLSRAFWSIYAAVLEQFCDDQIAGQGAWAILDTKESELVSKSESFLKFSRYAKFST